MRGRYEQYYDEWRQLYRMSYSSIDIARRYGCTPRNVAKYIKSIGLTRSREENKVLREIRSRSKVNQEEGMGV